MLCKFFGYAPLGARFLHNKYLLTTYNAIMGMTFCSASRDLITSIVFLMILEIPRTE